MSDDTLSRIAEWCGAEKDLEIDERTVTVSGDPPIEVGIDIAEDSITLAHTYSASRVPDGFAGRIDELLGGRGSMMSGELEAGDDEIRVHIRYPIYLDGLNRQTFLLAIREMTAAADGLAAAAGAAPAPEEEPAPEPETMPASEAEEMRAAAAVPAAEAETRPEPEPAAAATAVVPAAARWAPTHTVPGGGMSAWSEPDPSLAPVATLAARVELRVDEQRGAWARVTGSNGWTGWVDARKLRPLPGAGAPAGYQGAPTAARSGIAIRPVALLGGVAMIIGSFLSWVPPLDVDGWDVGAGWLWQGSLAHPRLGLVMAILGAAAILFAVLPRVPAASLAAVGIAGFLVMIVFDFQIIRVLADWQWEVLWNGDLGFGMYAALVGSILAVIPTEVRF